MSRARYIDLPNGDRHWYDRHRDGSKASAEQLELLATVETDCDLDAVLDASLTQAEVIKHLRDALGLNRIPVEVIERRERWRQERQRQPECCICHKKGDSTKHHFINKWILRELENYVQKWADRTMNTIPLCIDCHRDLHIREAGDKSIAPYLTDEQKRFAHEAIRSLIHEKPKLFELICEGDAEVSYEACLIRDWVDGAFRVQPADNSLRLVA